MSGDDRILNPDEYDPERRRVPDVFSYRLGKVEQQAERNESDLVKLERLVNEFIAGMPSKFVMREEFKQLADQMSSLATHLETYVATANASNAIRERNARERLSWHQQWPVYVLMSLTVVVAVIGYFVR